MANPIYLQLYTLRDDAAVNLHATLDAVAEAGYAGVELAGLYDLTPAALKAELDARGLTVIGAHSGYADLLADLRCVERLWGLPSGIGRRVWTFGSSIDWFHRLGTVGRARGFGPTRAWGLCAEELLDAFERAPAAAVAGAGLGPKLVHLLARSQQLAAGLPRAEHDADDQSDDDRYEVFHSSLLSRSA